MTVEEFYKWAKELHIENCQMLVPEAKKGERNYYICEPHINVKETPFGNIARIVLQEEL